MKEIKEFIQELYDSAAPVDTMTNNTTIELYSEYSEMKKRIIEDPIIFKASKIGAVIVTYGSITQEDGMA